MKTFTIEDEDTITTVEIKCTFEIEGIGNVDRSLQEMEPKWRGFLRGGWLKATSTESVISPFWLKFTLWQRIKLLIRCFRECKKQYANRQTKTSK